MSPKFKVGDIIVPDRNIDVRRQDEVVAITGDKYHLKHLSNNAGLNDGEVTEYYIDIVDKMARKITKLEKALT